MRPRSASIVLLAAGLVLSACGGSSNRQDASPTTTEAASGGGTTTTSGPPEPATLDGWLDAEGDVASPEDLLAAFAVAFGAMPDVEALDVDAPGVGSRTDLVDAVLAHWDDYSAEQQAAIGAAVVPPTSRVAYVTAAGPVGPPPATPTTLSGRRRSADPGAEAAAAAMVEQAMAQISAATGFAYPSPIGVVALDRREVEGDGTWAMALATSSDAYLDFGPDSPFGIQVWQAGPTASNNCVIFVGTAVTLDPAVGLEKIAHEVFHCFQYKSFGGTFDDFRARSPWRIEGSAAWVGLAVSSAAPNSQTAEWWDRYLQGNASGADGQGAYALTSGNGYSAIGFWSHLAQRGRDPWPLVLPVLAPAAESEAFADAIGDVGAMTAWGSSATQLGYTGAWQATGPAMTASRRTPGSATVGDGTSLERRVPNLTDSVLDVAIDGGTEYLLAAVEGPGTASFEGDDEWTIESTAVRAFCFLDDCACPDGHQPLGGDYSQRANDADLLVGFGGTPDPNGSKVTLQGVSREELCRCEGGDSGAGPLSIRQPADDGECNDPCLEGEWIADDGSLLAALRAFGVDAQWQVSGATRLAFDHGSVVATLGSDFTGIPADNPDLRVTGAFRGSASATYRAPGTGVLFIFGSGGSSTTMQLTVSGTATPAQPFFTIAGQQGSAGYECSPTDLVVRTGFPQPIVYHRA